jgi:hypothetical protein
MPPTRDQNGRPIRYVPRRDVPVLTSDTVPLVPATPAIVTPGLNPAIPAPPLRPCLPPAAVTDIDCVELCNAIRSALIELGFCCEET